MLIKKPEQPMKPIYLDYNATTPIDPKVAEAMVPYITEHFGNPSSGHYYGKAARDAVAKARKQIAAMLACRPEEIYFTSGGTESNNYAIKGAAFANRDKGNHIITSAVEHPAVIEVCRYLETQGFTITYLPVDSYGIIDPKQVERTITSQTILISIMHANNEIGTIEPITEIADIAHRHNVLLHSDCAQSIGKVPVRVDELKVDLLSIAGHKLYAPKGIGALYIKPGVKLEKLIHGANQEGNHRAGTENVIEIVGLGMACELIANGLSPHSMKLAKLRDMLQDGITKNIPDTIVNGHPEKRLPNTASIAFKGVKADALLGKMSGIAASAGAACHSDNVKISSVLEAMAVPTEYAMGTIRFSVGRYTSEDEINKAIKEIQIAVEDIRG
jgi:cysteine desulfurase